MSFGPDNKLPGRYAEHPGVADRAADETTRQHQLRVEQQLAEERQLARFAEIVAKRQPSSIPPKKGAIWAQVIAPVVVAAILAGGGALLVMWQSGAVADERQATTMRRVEQAEAEQREHTRTGDHPRTLEELSKLGARLDAISVRLDRIERQLDAQRTTRPR